MWYEILIWRVSYLFYELLLISHSNICYKILAGFLSQAENVNSSFIVSLHQIDIIVKAPSHVCTKNGDMSRDTLFLA